MSKVTVEVPEIGFEMADVFTEFDTLVAARPYLQEDSLEALEEDTLEDIFAEYDRFVADSPYLQG